MEFFGITYWGPQNYFKDILKDDYLEPMTEEEVEPLMKKVLENSTCPQNIQRPDVNVVRTIDCYMGRVNGFAYGSSSRFNRMKLKACLKPVGPIDMYRVPPTGSVDYGWWLCDPVLKDVNWYRTIPRYPQPASPNTLILDFVKRNDKFASLF